RLALPLPALALQGQDRQIRLSVVPGLRSSEGPLPGIEERVLLSAVVNEGFRLRAARCAGPREEVVVHAQPAAPLRIDCMPGERLALVLSAAPDDASREAFAALLPAAVSAGGWSEHWGPARSGGRDDAPLVARGHQVTLAVDAA